MAKISYSRNRWLLHRLNKLKILYPRLKTIYGPYLRKDGRYMVIIYCRDKAYTRQYSKVKMELKLGRRLHSDLETVDHIDDNKINDKYSNLQLLPRKVNAAKTHLTGSATSQHLVDYARSKEGRESSASRWQGERNILAKLTNKAVRQLRECYSRGEITKIEIAALYKFTSTKMVRAMLTGKTYKDAGGPIVHYDTGKGKGRPKTHTPEIIESWVRLRRKGWSAKRVAKKFNAHPSTVSRLTSKLL